MFRELEVSVDASLGHEIMDVNLITGTTSGSASYRDRLTYRAMYISVIYSAADVDWSTALHPRDFAFWDGMDTPFTVRWERDGGAAAKIYINDGLVFEGTSADNKGATTQFFMAESGTKAVDMNFYKFNIRVPEPATMLMLMLGGVGLAIRRRRTA